MKKIGVIFLGYPKTTKSGKEYYEGKLEGSDDKLMAFIGVSKKGSKYLSLLSFENNPEYQKKEEKKDNQETLIDPNELPF